MRRLAREWREGRSTPAHRRAFFHPLRDQDALRDRPEVGGKGALVRDAQRMARAHHTRRERPPTSGFLRPAGGIDRVLVGVPHAVHVAVTASEHLTVGGAGTVEAARRQRVGKGRRRRQHGARTATDGCMRRCLASAAAWHVQSTMPYSGASRLVHTSTNLPAAKWQLFDAPTTAGEADLCPITHATRGTLPGQRDGPDTPSSATSNFSALPAFGFGFEFGLGLGFGFGFGPG